jgi:hypothetical protein
MITASGCEDQGARRRQIPSFENVAGLKSVDEVSRGRRPGRQTGAAPHEGSCKRRGMRSGDETPLPMAVLLPRRTRRAMTWPGNNATAGPFMSCWPRRGHRDRPWIETGGSRLATTHRRGRAPEIERRVLTRLMQLTPFGLNRVAG